MTKGNDEKLFPQLVVCGLAPVADDVHATNHLPDSEKTNDLRSSDAGQGDLLLIGVANPGQEVLGRVKIDTFDGGRVAGDIGQGLEV